ncbi:MAG: Xylose isomerase, partial [uncultured Friedmanniella sp.]
DPHPHPRRQVLLRPVDHRLGRPGPVRRREPRAPRRGRGRGEAERAGRLRADLPRQRPVPAGVHRRRAHRADRPAQGRPGVDRRRRPDGHHQPVQPPGLQGRGLHLQRPRRPPLRAAQGAEEHRPGRGAGCGDLRHVGRPRGQRVRRRQGRAGGAGPLPRGRQPAGRVRHRQGLRHALRHRAEAERAPRRHPAPDRGPRDGLHRDPRQAGAVRDKPRDRPRADGGPELHPRRRPGPRRRQALPH